ncbi:MAG: hypothetical protein ACI4TW_06115, partial [Prevotella sp.]
MKSFIFSVLLMASCLPAVAAEGEETGLNEEAATVVCAEEENDTTVYTNYDRRIYRYRRLWNYLIPTQTIVQYAGNMGMISVG